MPFEFDDERKGSAGSFVFDDEQDNENKKKKGGKSASESVIDGVKTAGNYGLAIAAGAGAGVADLEAAAGTFIQAPVENLRSGMTGAAALVDRGVTNAANWVSPGSAQVNQALQETAQDQSAQAAAARERNVRGNPGETVSLARDVARMGQSMQEDGRRRSQSIQDFNQENNPELIAQQREVAKADGFIDTAKAVLSNPMALTNALAQSAPGMAAGAGMAMKAAQVAGGSTKVAGMVGAGSEGGMAAMQARESIYQQVAAIPVDKLAEGSPRYAEILAQVGNPEKARKALANELADQAPVLVGAGTVAGSWLTNKLFGGDKSAEILAGQRIAAKDIPRNFAQEGTEEVIQGIPEDLTNYTAMSQADKDTKLDLGGGAASNFIAGGILGGGGSAGAYVGQKIKDFRSGTPPEDTPAPNVTPNDQGGAPVNASEVLGAPTASKSAPVQTGAVGTSDTSAAVEALKAQPTDPLKLTNLSRMEQVDRRLAELPEDAPERAMLLQDRAALTKDFPTAVPGNAASFSTESGVKLEGQYALMDADDLITSHDEGLRVNPRFPQELQPRERDRAASELQISGIVQRLDPARLGVSADAATGAPIVGADGLVESGNARTIALKRVYGANGLKAENYRTFLADNAAQFGITPEAVSAMGKPVLVRIRTTPVNRAEFARQANASTVAQMSPSEQAKSDAARIDVLEDLNPDDNGDFSTSRDFIRRFVGKLPATEQGAMLDANGGLSSTGYTRVRNAVLAKAYGDSPVLARMVESMDDNLRNISKALMTAAPKVAQMRQAIAQGNRFDADITPDLVAAVEELSRLKDSGTSVADALAQAGMFGDQYSEETKQLLQFLADNIRRPRRMADFIVAYMEALDAAGDPNQGSLLGDVEAPAKGELLNSVKKGLDNDGTQNNEAGAEKDAQRGNPGEGAPIGEQGAGQPADASGSGRGDQGNGAAGSGQSQDVKTKEPASEWVNFPKESGTIGIPRADMPQIKSEHRGALLQFLKARGIDNRTDESVPASDFKPTQAEFSIKKTASWAQVRDGSDRSVLVSSDGHILDGHHQWMAAVSANEPVKAIVLDAPIRELLTNVFQFPSVQQSQESAKATEGRTKARDDFKAAMGDLANLMADTLGTRAMMMPPGNPKLQQILVRLFSAAIDVVGTDLKAATKWVKDKLKADPETKPWWNKITDKDYQSAALAAMEAGAKAHVDDLFSKAEKAQAGLFDDAPVAPKVAMINGRPYDYAEKTGDNFQIPEPASFLPADVITAADAFVKKYFTKADHPMTQAERAEAEKLLAPNIAKAQEAKTEYDQKIIDIAKSTKALGQLLAPIKSLKRGAEKMWDDARENGRAMDAGDVTDLLRSTIVVDSYANAQGVLDAIHKEFKVIRFKNKTTETMREKQGGYADFTVFVRMDNGVMAEIQINVPAMLSAKENQGHKLYEAARSLEGSNPLKAEINSAMRVIYDAAFAGDTTILPDAANSRDRAMQAKNASSEAGAPLRGPASSMPGKGISDAPSSEALNQPSPGIETYSSPEKPNTNREPSGKLSGTLIGTPPESIVADKTKNGYGVAPKNEDVGEQLYANRRNFTGRGLKWDDIAALNDTLKVKEVTKAKIWPRPNYENLVADGMPPVLARLVKQVYDGISSGPTAKAVSDEGLKLYVDTLQKVREGLLSFAMDKEAVGDFAGKILMGFQGDRAAAGGPVSLASMVGGNTDMKAVAETLLRRVWPEEFKGAMRPFANGTRALNELKVIGGSKALGAMQFVRTDMAKWVTDLNKGWPSKREAWEVQGYRVLAPSDYTADTPVEAVRYNRETGKSEPTGRMSHRVALKVGRGSWGRMDEPFTAGKYLLVQDGGFGAKEFDTHVQAVDAAREAVKRKTGTGQDVRGMNVVDSERTGVARRMEGDDVTSQRLMDDFGFRGVNFGREGWINQAERQAYLNQAYDGLMDLADILGVPAKALSLNGELGIAFGAQGKGKNAAHFVAGVNEINLTKTKGAGTLAHEWGHAMDHYFAKLAGLATSEEPFLSEHAVGPAKVDRIGRDGKHEVVSRLPGSIRPEVAQAFSDIRAAMDKRTELPGEAKLRLTDRLARSTKNLNSWLNAPRRTIENSDAANKKDLLVEFDQLAEKMRTGDVGEGYEKVGNKIYMQAVAQMRNLVKDATGRLLSVDDTEGLQSSVAMVKHLTAKLASDLAHEPQQIGTTYKSESLRADKDKGGKAYWATPTEMFARAFELFVHDKLAEKGAANTFLTDSDARAAATKEVAASAGNTMPTSESGKETYLMPYPRGEERKAVATAFEKLIDTIQTQEGEDGKVSMLSRGAVPGGMDFDALTTVVNRIKARMPNMPKVHVLRGPAEAPMALKLYIQKQGAWDDVEGAIHNGELYMFASGLSGALRAEHVLAEHEAAHFGLRGILGKDRTKVMQSIWVQNPEIRKAAAKLQAQGRLSNAEATEEVLVDIPTAQLARLKGWRALVMKVRDFLADSGFEAMAEKLTRFLSGTLGYQQRADMMVADLVRAARAYAAGNTRVRGSVMDTTTALSDGVKSMAEDAAQQEKWLNAEARARGYADIDALVDQNYPLFEKLAVLWRKDHPAETLLSRNIENTYKAAKDKGQTKLTYRQWVQVRTPEFKTWWGSDWEMENANGLYRASETNGGEGESAGSNKRRQEQLGSDGLAAQEIFYDPETGEPRVFYHGTRDEISAFDVKHPNKKDAGWLGRGHYVTSDKWLAETYSRLKTGPKAPNVLELFVRPIAPEYFAPEDKKLIRNLAPNELSEFNRVIRDSGKGGTFTKFEDGSIEICSFDATALKSATANSGAFDPSNPDINLSRAPAKAPTDQRAETIIQTKAASRAPLDMMTRMLTKVTGTERILGAVYDRAAMLLDRITPENVKAGIVSDYGVPEAVIDKRSVMQGNQRKQLRAAGSLIEKLATLTREESRVAYEWMNMDGSDPRAYMSMLQGLPEESVKVLTEVQKLIDQLSQEAMRLGQLSPEAYKANRFAYLRRSYVKHTAELTTGEAKKRARAITVLGDQYKGRGMTDAANMNQIQNLAPEWWKRKLQAGKADASLKGEKFVRLERRAASGEGVKPLEGMTGKAPGKLLEIAYYPAGEKLPAKYQDWNQAGEWTVRDVKGGNLVMWRDFTKTERETMGEIDEARFAIAKTLHGMINDVEVGRYLEWLGQTYAKADGESIPGNVVEASERMRDTFKPDDWVKVPETKISGTNVYRYGKLAGRYLPGPIWNDLRQVVNGQFQPLGETYSNILRMWKTSKTALSPAVHTNNIMSNFVMADWHDVSAGHMAKSLRILLAASKQSERAGMGGAAIRAASTLGRADVEASKAIVARYQDSGGDIGGWATQEIRDEQLQPLLDMLEKELAVTAGNSVSAQVGVFSALQHALMLRLPSAYEALKGGKVSGKVVGAVTTEANNLIDLYQSEDDVFRLAAWLKAKEEGRTDLEAGKASRESFLDYRINAPWVQAMRQTAWPFISFTYRAVPMFLETAAKKPHKLMKLMLLAGGLNALGALLAGGDDEKERKLLPEEKAGRIWGMVPKLIRMPWNDSHDSPVYLDIRRFVPVGDVFDIGAGHSAVPMLPGLTPGGPLVLAGELVLNKSAFTGKPITLETDTRAQQAGKVVDYLYKAFAPNILGLPNTYATTGVVDAANGRTDAFGREMSVTQAVASSFGMKLGSYPVDVLRRNAKASAAAQISEIDKNIAQLKRQRQTNRISAEDFQSQVTTEQEKKRKVMEDLAKKM